MTIFGALRRPSPHDASGQSEPAGGAQAGPAAEAPLPFAGYGRLDDRQVVDGLSDHSQVELEAIESYERSHRNREAVLNKLHYMRGREPLPGYDARSAEEIATALKEADLATVKSVRSYERKFANRRDVLEEVDRVHRGLRATQPASATPGYQPQSATSR